MSINSCQKNKTKPALLHRATKIYIYKSFIRHINKHHYNSTNIIATSLIIFLIK